MKIHYILFILAVSFDCLAQTNRDKNFSAAVDSMYAKYMRDDGPGGSLFVQCGKNILYQRSFGLADLTTKKKFTENTVSNLGSISKTFVAYGILKLREEGKLSLDDNLLKYFPDFKNKELARKVTIRHLLTHTSGLQDNRPVDKDGVFFLTANDEQNFAPIKQNDTLEFEPGTHWNYSNPAFNGLALIIEKVSGMKWQKFIQKNIFTPAGMHDSKITDGAFPSKGVAHAYIPDSGRWQEYDYGEYPTFCAAGNGGVWSSIQDLRKYYRAIKNNVFLKKSTIALSQTLWMPEHWSDTLRPRNGFSWFVQDPDSALGHKIYFHTGHQAGFIAFFYVVPEKDVLVILELNFAPDPDDVEVYSILKLLKRFGYI